MSYDEDDTMVTDDSDLDGEEKPLDLEEPLEVPEEEEEFDPDSRYH